MTRRSLRFTLPALALAAFAAIAAPAGAAPAAEPAQQQRRAIEAAAYAIGDALVPIGLAKGYVAVCAARDPAGAAERDGAHARWRSRNAVPALEAALSAVEPKAPGLAQQRRKLDDAAHAQAAETVDRDPATCRRLAGILAAPAFTIAPAAAHGRRLLLTIAGRS
ncbi:MAG: hypothetical protein AB7P02_02905 [Alphaproteobacteria bacterium]